MLSLDEGSQIPAYVEQTLLTWVRLHPGFQTTADIVELTNGKFFLVLLQTLQNFKLLSPLSQLNDDHHLAAKVSIIKNISKSLNYFHQTELHRDVSQFEINCVQLCMGNKKQLLRLITIVLSAVYSQVSSKLAVQQQMSRLSQQQYEVLRIMVQNSLNLGQECESCCSRSWRLSQQKNVFLKMETLENKIEQLEILNKNLEQMLRTQKEAEQTAVQQSKKLKQQIKRLLILNDQLVESNEKTINELKISSIEQGTTKKKFEVVKSKLQQKISKLQEQVHKLLQTSHQNKILSQKIAKITQINTEIKQQNKCLRQNLNKLEHEKAELKLLNKAHNQQFLTLKQHCSELEIKVQELMLACSIKMSGQAENSYQRTCFFGNLQLESGSQSNRYRIAENLGWLNNQLSCSQQLMEDSKIKRDNKFQIRTITQRSLQDSICLQHLKQNQSILMNNSQIQSFPPSFALQNSLKKSQSQSIKKSNNSFSISQYENLQRQYIEQIKILTCVILDLQMQLEEANKRNPIVCISNDSVAGKRMEKFKSKVKEMFGKGSKVESQ